MDRSPARIPDDWTPTVENINVLPERLRKYIHDLRRNSEFLVLLRENAELRKEIAALRRKSNDLRWQNARFTISSRTLPQISFCPLR
jgi:hypothetical protein